MTVPLASGEQFRLHADAGYVILCSYLLVGSWSCKN